VCVFFFHQRAVMSTTSSSSTPKKRKRVPGGKRKRAPKKQTPTPTPKTIHWTKRYVLVPDCNENAVGGARKYMNEIKFQVAPARRLIVGDFVVERVEDDGDNSVVAVIERKTHADLFASILDGRYKKQMYAMQESGAPRSIYVLIEEPDNAWWARTQHPETNKKMILSAMARMAVNGMGVICLKTDDQVPHVLNKIAEDIDEVKKTRCHTLPPSHFFHPPPLLIFIIIIFLRNRKMTNNGQRPREFDVQSLHKLQNESH